MRDYQAERTRQEMVRDAETLGYATEAEGLPPLVTFKKWLIDHAGPSDPDASVEPTPHDWEPPPGF